MIAATLLTAAFNQNAFQTVTPGWFDGHSAAMEGWVAGRMAIARREGFLSYGGVLGDCIDAPPPQRHTQLEIYQRDLEIASFVPYYSQVGFQGLAAAVFDSITDFTTVRTWALLRLITSVLTAVFISILLAWLGGEFGWMAFAASLASTVFAPWVTVFGAKLFWASGAFYLPLASVLWLVRRESGDRPPSRWGIVVTVASAVLVKCLFNGYEFITTTLVMMMVPLVYATWLHRWAMRRFLDRAVCVSGAALLGVLLSMAILCAQIGSIRGSFSDGVSHIVYSFRKRTYANPAGYDLIDRRSLQAGVGEVVRKYLAGTALGHRRDFDGMHPESLDTKPRITYRDLLFLFAASTALALVLIRQRRRRGSETRRLEALIVSTWFSLLAPLSWFLIFKSHSYLHPHLNFIVWHMPFVPVGAALSGFVVAQGSREAWRMFTAPRPGGSGTVPAGQGRAGLITKMAAVFGAAVLALGSGSLAWNYFRTPEPRALAPQLESVQRLLRLHPTLGYLWKPDRDLASFEKLQWLDLQAEGIDPASIGTDSHGFLNHPRAIEGGTSSVDIVGLGDAFIHDAAFTFYEFFESRGYRYYNLAVHGHSPPQYNRILGEYAFPMRPKHVLYGIYADDFREVEDYVRWRNSGEDWFAYHAGWWGGPPRDPISQDARSQLARVLRYAERAHDLCSERGIEFTVALIPSKELVLHAGRTPSTEASLYDSLARSLRLRGVSVIDLRNRFSRAKDPGALFRENNARWSHEGMSKAARIYLKRVERSAQPSPPESGADS